MQEETSRDEGGTKVYYHCYGGYLDRHIYLIRVDLYALPIKSIHIHCVDSKNFYRIDFHAQIFGVFLQIAAIFMLES